MIGPVPVSVLLNSSCSNKAFKDETIKYSPNIFANNCAHIMLQQTQQTRSEH